jgi:hypothetical protein
MAPASVGVVSSTTELAARRQRRPKRIAVVIRSPWFRRSIIEQLRATGYEICGTNSLSEVRALIAAGAIDALALDVSTYPTAVLSELGRLTKGHLSVSLIASVCVVSMERRSRRRVSMYWVPFLRYTEFSAGLSGHTLN